MFACKIIFAQQFGNHIEDIMRLEVVNGVRKDYRRWPIEEGDRKELVFELSSEVVVNNIDPKTEENRYYRYAYAGDWICRDDHATGDSIRMRSINVCLRMASSLNRRTAPPEDRYSPSSAPRKSKRTLIGCPTRRNWLLRRNIRTW